MDEQEEALRARANARIGSTLREKYRLDRVLGIGGMATVFAATHRNQAELAVKVLHPELCLRDDLKKRFLREGYVANSVKHPGAVLVVDDDVAEDGSAFLVMELLRGATVEEIWEGAGRQLSTRAVTALTLQLLDVLSSAHEKAIVHRDLKPANLFLTTDGSLKVLDFGIARLRDALGSSEHATRTGTLMGTPAFMAPEQAQAVAEEIDGQTDVWAVGATMFTLLSGLLVHDGDNSSQLLIRAGTARARAVATVVPGIEPEIAEVVDRALVFEKPGRWANATEMRDALVAATTRAFGKPPGRDALADLLHSRLRKGGLDSDHMPGTPRLVVEGAGTDIRANDPTFATPSSGMPKGPTPLPASGLVSGIQPPLHGLSTANPVSREAATLRPKARTVPLSGVIVAALLAGAAVAAGVFAFGRTNRNAVVAAATVNAAPQASAPASSAPSVAPPAVSAEPAVAQVASATPSAAPPAAHQATVAVTSPAKPTKPPTAPAKPVSPAPSAAPNCSSLYTLDADGNKKWKPECMTQ